jgi:hypothetical protein
MPESANSESRRLEATATPQPPEITLEEWIASCQSCCGVEPGSQLVPQQTIPDETTKKPVEREEQPSPP